MEVNPDLFDLNQDANLYALTDKLKGLLTWAFGIGTLVFIALIWRSGLALARSGDNPQARAQAQSALWMNVLGGLVFFGGAIVTAVIRNVVQ